jgi:hypothetical protein
MRKMMCICVGLVAAFYAASIHAAGWGSVKGKFVYDGVAPKPAAIVADKDPAVCGVAGLVDESLVVGKDGGLANVLVSLIVKPGGKKPEVHADFAKDAGKKIDFDNKGCRFSPRMIVLRTDQVLVLKNTDPVAHNVKGNALVNTPFNPILPGLASIDVKLTKEERLPMECTCAIHPWMKGYVVVRDDPYAAVSAADGTFEIKNLPEGTWTLRGWQERSGFLKEVKIGTKTITPTDKGQFDVKIENGKTLDLGTIKVPGKIFK